MKKIIFLTICIILNSFAFAQQNSKEIKLTEMIENGMKDWQIPGLTTVIVKNGEVVFKKAFGVKDVETKEPVDLNTTFTMASTTKAITAISLGILVDRGKIKWDDKVQDYLPSFKLSDSYITADARVIDLLTHNLGIGNADLLFEIDTTSTAEIISRFKHAKQTYPLRGGFTYQNIMYIIAGELVKTVSGQNWEDFIEDNIFIPLEMNRTSAKPSVIKNAGNYTSPHINHLEDGIHKVELNINGIESSAGGIWSSANDISNYLKFLLNKGVYKQDTIMKPETFNFLFEPHSILTQEEYYATNTLTKPNWNTYGLGWFQQDYRGEKLDFHTGSLTGLVAIAGIIHKENFAVFVFANLDHAELRHAIMYKAIDLYVFNDDSRDWHQETFELYSKFREQSIEGLKKRDKERVLGTTPSLSLNQYSGIYTNEMYGKVIVNEVDGKLDFLVFNNLKFQTEHWHYNTFISNKTPKLLYRFFVNFNLNESGKIKELEVFGETFIKTD